MEEGTWPTEPSLTGRVSGVVLAHTWCCDIIVKNTPFHSQRSSGLGSKLHRNPVTRKQRVYVATMFKVWFATWQNQQVRAVRTLGLSQDGRKLILTKGITGD